MNVMNPANKSRIMSNFSIRALLSSTEDRVALLEDIKCEDTNVSMTGFGAVADRCLSDCKSSKSKPVSSQQRLRSLPNLTVKPRTAKQPCHQCPARSRDSINYFTNATT